jgi:hypothetical protein
MLRLIIVAILLSGLSAGQSQDKQLTEEQAMALAARTAEATINWENSSSPGMKAELLLIKKGEVKGSLVVTYKIKVTGAPRDQRYVLTSWPIIAGSPITLMDGLVIDQTGAVMCPAHSTDSCARGFDGTEVKLGFAPVKGEILRNALISKDQKSRIFFSTVPDPIIKKDAACSLELVRLGPQYELVLIRAKGFLSGESVAFHTKSYDEAHDVNAKANAQGEFWAPLTPFVKDKTKGTTEVVAKGSRCSPALSFNWGSEQ